MISPTPLSPVENSQHFHPPGYLAACERALYRLRTELYVYHDPNVPEATDPDGVVESAIKRITELYWATRHCTPDGIPSPSQEPG